MPTFNLVEEPWIPCIVAGEDLPSDLSLRSVLTRASEISEIADASPLVTAALHRLLLAVLHRVFGPSRSEDWSRLRARGSFDAGALDDYLGRWAHRFDLFDDRWPFYQVASLDFSYAVPIARLAHELARDTSNALFNHGPADALAMTPAKAARYLVAHQAFALGGLVSRERGQDPALFRSADAAPLAKGAVCLVKGRSLFETLLLNLHRYAPDDDVPCPCSGDDCPAWERSEEMRAADRRPSGYLDLLTWQSRRIRLQPEQSKDGQTIVPSVVIMKGSQFPDGVLRRDYETMLSFRRNDGAKAGQDPWPALAFREDRALWRDSTALFQSLDDSYEPPKTLTWLGDLVDDGALDPASVIPIDVLGLSADRAKVFLWRHERLSVPLRYLSDRRLVAALQSTLVAAEQVGDALEQAGRILAALALAPDSDQEKQRQPDRGDVRGLADSLGLGRAFWPRLEAPFRELLLALPGDVVATDDGLAYGGEALPRWVDLVCRAAWEALDRAASNLDASARLLKATAQAQRYLGRKLRELRDRYELLPLEVSQ
jgi:CRISPR system Cascade subunit CasA